MSDDDKSAGGATGSPPHRLGREPPVLRKRFYKGATVVAGQNGFVIELDGRPTRTPRKLPLAVPSKSLASAIAAEWAAQVATIQPSSMPLTSLACTAIDAVADQMAVVADEIGSYAMSDLLCYRAEQPKDLAALQGNNWDPVLAWASSLLGRTFQVTSGLMHVAQHPEIKPTVVALLAPLDPFRLSAMHVLTTLTGSACLALAVLQRRLGVEEAWRLAHLDEDWQIGRWGSDAESAARRAHRLATAVAASKVLDMLG